MPNSTLRVDRFPHLNPLGQYPLRLSGIFSTFLLVVPATRLAWMSDVSLITLRAALYNSHGWGLGFNATEAVQGYMHPLLFLLRTGIGSLSTQWVLGTISLSVCVSTASLALNVCRIISVSILIVALAILLFFNAFMEYTTSGLEIALACILVTVSFFVTIRISDV